MYQGIRNDPDISPTCREANTHEELVRRAREGDNSAFTELIRDIHIPLCTFLARLVGNDELGHDLAQETLLRAWKSLPGLREERYFKAWLYRIATNIAHSHQRSTRRMRWLPWTKIEAPDDLKALNIAGPEEHISEAEIVEKTLARLSPQYRTCLLLQLVAGFSQQEIAHLLGISQKSVGTNVCRGREQFRQIYQALKGNVK
jgi:RNA polymerase sigma-70 factor (ECF subfamily)